MKAYSTYLTTAVTMLMVAGFATDLWAESLTTKCNEAKAEFLKKDESLKAILGKTTGYVMFPSVAKGALGVGAATGRGELFEKGKDKPAGHAKLTQVTIGFQGVAKPMPS